MARIVSFVVLCVVLLLVGGLFVRVMADFVLPLFMALLLVVIFGPMHRAVERRCGGHKRLAAALSTSIILLTVLVPIAGVLTAAAAQGIQIMRTLQGEATATPKSDVAMRRDEAGTQIPGAQVLGEQHPLGDQQAALPDAPVSAPVEASKGSVFDPRGLGRALAAAGARIGLDLSAEELQPSINQWLQQWLTPLALSTPQWLLRIGINFFIMAIALYYFLADGPQIIATMMRLSPLDEQYEKQLIAQFDSLTRAVVLATVLSALAQGLLAGVGYFVAGVGSVALLTVATALMAMVPFVGATIVWLPVCLYLYFYEGRHVAGIGLAVYSTVVVSSIDNVIKPLVLKGGANLHPLLALLSVMGGVQVLGAIGLFVGPMVVAFLQTLLTMFHAEVAALSGVGRSAEAGVSVEQKT